MKYTHSIEDKVLEITFSGDLMGESNGPELVELANEALIQHESDTCLLDMSDIRYINSSGIGVLITLLTKYRNKSGELYLINPSDHVKKLLIMTKLEAIFNIVDSKSDIKR